MYHMMNIITPLSNLRLKVTCVCMHVWFLTHMYILLVYIDGDHWAGATVVQLFCCVVLCNPTVQYQPSVYMILIKYHATWTIILHTLYSNLLWEL